MVGNMISILYLKRFLLYLIILIVSHNFNGRLFEEKKMCQILSVKIEINVSCKNSYYKNIEAFICKSCIHFFLLSLLD